MDTVPITRPGSLWFCDSVHPWNAISAETRQYYYYYFIIYFIAYLENNEAKVICLDRVQIFQGLP